MSRHSGAPYVITIKYNDRSIVLELSPSSTYREMQQRIYDLTRVHPDRQKLIGFCPGFVLPEDPDVAVSMLGISPSRTCVMVGSSDDPVHGGYPFNVFLSAPERKLCVMEAEILRLPSSAQDYLRDAEVLARLNHRIATTKLDYIHPPRPGYKLLVLDIDYTFYDMKSMGKGISLFKRPYTDEFLQWAYQYFDLMFWSQTTWNWIEAKLSDMKILSASNYHVCCALDRAAMFPVTSIHKGALKTHEVKPLQVVWSIAGPENGYGPHNTLHIDDLSRNFALNATNGIKVRAYKNAPVMRADDKELIFLQRYLEKIRSSADFSKLDHNHWRRKVTEPGEDTSHSQHGANSPVPEEFMGTQPTIAAPVPSMFYQSDGTTFDSSLTQLQQLQQHMHHQQQIQQQYQQYQQQPQQHQQHQQHDSSDKKQNAGPSNKAL
eukprot:ANDGO_01299.mRNA.1 Ubiquitin-like domain-containing CTD phosphatase